MCGYWPNFNHVFIIFQFSETVRGHEREKARLASLQQTEREAWEAERQREVDRLHQEAEESVHLSEMRAGEQHERDVQVTRDLEAQLARLREELAQSNQLRKEQLLELGNPTRRRETATDARPRATGNVILQVVVC